MSDCTCSACSKLFVDPRILPCLHTFCRECLERTRPVANQGVHCPKCLKTFSVSPENLSKNVRVELEVKVAQVLAKMTAARQGTSCEGCSQGVGGSAGPAKAFCADCDELICQRCWDQHKRHLSLKKHKIVPCGAESVETLQWLLRSTEYRCSSIGHDGEEWSAYCDTCGKLSCEKCIEQDHREHQHCSLDVVSGLQRAETAASLARARETLDKLTHAIKNRRVAAEHVESNFRTVALTITTAFEELEKTLRERKKALLTKLEVMMEPSKTALILQQKEFEKTYKELSDCTEATARLFESHTTDAEMAALKGVVPAQLQAALKASGDVPLCAPPHHSAVLSLDTSGLLETVQTLGEVQECSPLHSSWATVVPGLPSMNASHQVKVETKGPSGDKLNGGGLQVKGRMVPKLDTTHATIGEVEDHRDGSYTITFMPHVPGSHQLSIMVEGCHVSNSPCHLYVNRDYTSDIGSAQYFNIHSPNFVAVGDNKDIYVSSDIIHILGPDGGEKMTIGSVGSGDGQFSSPQGIAIHGGAIYVADKFNHRIQKLTTDGKFLQVFGQGQSSGLCVDPGGRIIAANGQNTVLVFSSAGTLMHSISGSTQSNAGFHSPHSVAVDLQGNIHVAARKTSSIKVFSSEGSFVRMYGNLIEPTGVAIDRGGYCLVCEAYTSFVSVFDPQGKPVTKIQTHLLKQLALAVDEDGYIYVSSSDDNAVVKI